MKCEISKIVKFKDAEALGSRLTAVWSLDWPFLKILMLFYFLVVAFWVFYYIVLLLFFLPASLITHAGYSSLSVTFRLKMSLYCPSSTVHHPPSIDHSPFRVCLRFKFWAWVFCAQVSQLKVKLFLLSDTLSIRQVKGSWVWWILPDTDTQSNCHIWC